jgi:hypothetical protein
MFDCEHAIDGLKSRIKKFLCRSEHVMLDTLTTKKLIKITKIIIEIHKLALERAETSIEHISTIIKEMEECFHGDQSHFFVISLHTINNDITRAIRTSFDLECIKEYLGKLCKFSSDYELMYKVLSSGALRHKKYNKKNSRDVFNGFNQWSDTEIYPIIEDNITEIYGIMGECLVL